MSSGASGGAATGDAGLSSDSMGRSVAEEDSHEDFRPQVRAAAVQGGDELQKHIEQVRRKRERR